MQKDILIDGKKQSAWVNKVENSYEVKITGYKKDMLKAKKVCIDTQDINVIQVVPLDEERLHLYTSEVKNNGRQRNASKSDERGNETKVSKQDD